jgi:hypothetical protein
LEYVNSQLKIDSFDTFISEGFDLFILSCNLSDNYEVARSKVDKSHMTQDEIEAYDFFAFHTGRIEVFIEDELFRVYFPILPVCRYISSQSKDRLMMTVNRKSPQHKILDFLKQTPDLIDEMFHREKLRRAWILITEERLNYAYDFSTFLSFVINIIMLFGYKWRIEFHQDGFITRFPYINEILEYIIFCLGII